MAEIAMANELVASQGHVLSAQFYQAESWVIAAVAWLRLVVETMGALVIAIGIIVAIVGFTKVMLFQGGQGFRGVRLTLARYLALALEFQLGADILSTAISPSWEQIGKLAAIAVIRTGLNYFLMHEIKVARKEQQEAEEVAAKST